MKPFLTIGAGLLICSLSFADSNWMQFRGPNGSGIAAKDQKPPVELSLSKNLKWKVKVPLGASSPIVVGERLILTAFEDNQLWTISYSTKDGKELWRKQAPVKKIEDFHKSEGSPAASTPVSDGKQIVSYFGSCGLICYDLEGNEKWKYELPTAETNNRFGTGTSPTLHDGIVILQRDLAKGSSLYAINLENGSLIWEKKRDGFPTSYGSPIIWENQVITTGFMQMKAYDLKSGAEKWTVSNLPSAVCTTPVVGEDYLFFAGWSPGNEDFPLPTFDELLKEVKDDGEGFITLKKAQGTFLANFFESNDTNGDGKITREEWEATLNFMKKGRNFAMAIKPGGKGDVTRSHVVWTKTKGLPYVSSPLLYEGQLFMLKDGGLASALEAKTGNEIYLQERIGAGGSYYSSPVAANGHIYVASLEGMVSVLKVGPELNVVAKLKLTEPIKATPAIANNTLYIRSTSMLFAFGEK